MIQSRIERIAIAKGMSLSQIKGEAATSGYHLALSLDKILKIARSERKYYSHNIREFLKVLLKTANYTKKYNFPDDPILNLDFGEIAFPESAKEKSERDSMDIINGFKSRIDVLMERNPDLTRDQAIEEAKRIDEEEQMFKSPNPFEEKEEDEK